jgi:hypothetical protein
MQLIEQEAILSTSYLPNIQYFSKFQLHKQVIIESHDTYLKQSYRNRCTIYASNGALDLSIPVIRPNGNKTLTKDVLIEYNTKWQVDHWRTIKSAYGNSPFFEIFEPELAYLYESKEKYLFDFNNKALTQIFNSIGTDVKIYHSKKYIEQNDSLLYDYRNSIHPKKRMQKPDAFFNQQPYFQVFAEKYGFIPNLSFIDLMFNEGPQALDICRKSISHPKVSG